MTAPAPLWRPADADRDQANLTRYMRWLQEQGRFDAQGDYQRLWQWSVDCLPDFWASIWDYFEVQAAAPYSAVLADAGMPGAQWFPGATLNYADHVFRKRTDARPAILYQSERQALTALSWAELERQTAALAHFFRESGVKPGDRIAAFLPNIPQAIAAVLASMSVGAVWSSCSPDFGVSSVVDRFAQIKPKILLVADGYAYGGKIFDKRDATRDLCTQLPTLEQVIFIPFLDQDAAAPFIVGAKIHYWSDVINAPAPPLQTTPVPFDHPLWVLYSSGTTGAPKAITHSQGGNLLEHLKYLHFHNDLRPGERFFWFSTTGWMMWNFTCAALLTGATIVLYDGSPGYPDLNVLWQLAETAQVNHFGTSAPFLVSCLKAGLEPGRQFDLSALRSIGSTGSPLPPEGFDWVYNKVKSDVWLASMSGGTDVCTAWVGGNPLLPVYTGEIQCRCLGCAMESWDEAGSTVAPGDTGEMVVTQPMPSMPVFFWNDPAGTKYRSSYFEHYPGVWRHGDWLQITPRQTLVILGRSDATLNRQGVRIGTAEIYRALDTLPEIRDALIVNLERPDGTDWMPLFAALQTDVFMDEALEKRIRQTLRQLCSPRHVPDAIVVVPDIPYTLSGKKMEMPVKKILLGRPPAQVFSADAIKNPHAMDFFVNYGAELLGKI